MADERPTPDNPAERRKMKITNAGKRYDTEKCVALCERDHRSSSGNYSGSTFLLLASNGAYILPTSANGQDCYLSSGARVVDLAAAREFANGADMSDEQQAAAIKCGLIEMVE